MKLSVFVLALAMLLPVAVLRDSHLVRGVLAVVLVGKAIFLARLPTPSEAELDSSGS